jgi:ATP-binding cassette subfamily C protein
MGDYIKSLPMGVHTHISENSTTFSAGQIQLIALARALIGQPRMLIFDEATSALDNLSVQRIGTLLDALKITRIVFTHRINTLRNCDTILVMGKGQMVQQGTFAELENTDGLFNAMLHGKTE